MFRDIFNTYRQAFRLYVRQRTRPLSVEEAEEKRLFWSKCYLFCGFCALVSATWFTKKENLNFSYDPSLKKEEAVLDKLIHSPTKIVHYKNFKKVDEFMYTPKSAQKKDEKAETPSAE